ncbi:MAG TPA: hypothetical protein DCM64_07525 [Gammaproteobacteria bacterium]|nr:hypothetical protein [Gammaproteobacteria bacterium]MDP6733418.1 hypothetical protein [Gammaproteobacteria bacterium]HAJ76290.1 hypothetical protein [Gammaproteobacteria bacterium]
MSRFKRLVAGAFAVLLMGLIAAPLYAQLPANLRDYPLAQFQKSGDLVAPFFDGWIDNGDGSVTMVFGFMNRNTDEIVDIPLGPNNYIRPVQFDGVQPSHFPVYRRFGLTGIRERGAFAVTVPAGMAGTEIVWTLSHAGHSYSVPGRAASIAYEMSSAVRALGSLNPGVQFTPGGPEGYGREGVMGPRVNASVGTPVTLSAFVRDNGERAGYDLDSNYFPVGTEWILHQGPAMARPEFEPQSTLGRNRVQAGEGGDSDWTEVTTQATFSEPGEYVVRLRVDNFAAPDSRFDNQCCWTNGYIPVTVTP